MPFRGGDHKERIVLSRVGYKGSYRSVRWLILPANNQHSLRLAHRFSVSENEVALWLRSQRVRLLIPNECNSSQL